MYLNNSSYVEKALIKASLTLTWDVFKLREGLEQPTKKRLTLTWDVFKSLGIF